MARQCALTGKKTQRGGRYSNRIRATQYNPSGKVGRKVNLMKRRIFVPELNRHVTVSLSAKALRILNKKGAYRALKEAGIL